MTKRLQNNFFKVQNNEQATASKKISSEELLTISFKNKEPSQSSFKLSTDEKFDKSKICKKVPWSQIEDDALKSSMKKNQINNDSFNWASVAESMREHLDKINYCCSTVRSGKQCRERWFNHLSNEKVNNKDWTSEEEEKLFFLNKQKGNKWSEIASVFKDRTDNQVKNHYYSSLRKKIRKIRKKLISQGFTTQTIGEEKFIYERIKQKVSYLDLNEDNLIDILNLKDNKFNSSQNLLPFNNYSVSEKCLPKINPINNMENNMRIIDQIYQLNSLDRKVSSFAPPNYAILSKNVTSNSFASENKLQLDKFNSNIPLPDMDFKMSDIFDGEYYAKKTKMSYFNDDEFLKLHELRGSAFQSPNLIQSANNSFVLNKKRKISLTSIVLNDELTPIEKFETFCDKYNSIPSMFLTNNQQTNDNKQSSMPPQKLNS